MVSVKRHACDNYDLVELVATDTSILCRIGKQLVGKIACLVSRKTLEKQLSARLFKQTSSGYVLTASESIEGLVLGSHRRIEGADAELSGEVYISISDIFDESCICSKPG